MAKPNVTVSYAFDSADSLCNNLTDEKLRNIKAVLCVLFPRRVKEPLLSCSRIGALNFHPAPLPEYRGVAPYSFGIYENVNHWAVSAHFMDLTIEPLTLVNPTHR
jgi:methionyl-tRNA formyltransferase